MHTHHEIMEAMEEAERSLAEQEPKWAQAASALVRLQARHDLREAQLTLSFKGVGTIPEVSAHVESAMWSEPDDLMGRLIELQAEVIGYATVYKTLDRRLSSMQSRLNAVLKTELNPPSQ